MAVYNIHMCTYNHELKQILKLKNVINFYINQDNLLYLWFVFLVHFTASLKV